MSDDDASSDAARSKVELDVEKHLLGTTVQLADGTEGLVFSRGPKNESQMFLYNCHLCGVPNLPGERCLQTHIAGRKHQSRMQQPSIDPDTFRAPLVHKPKIQMNIAPGEPIPPGFENEVKPVAEIQASFDKFRDESLVGLEYVIELTKSYEKEPNYVCILCDKRGDPRTITRHLISYNHRLKFLEKHYPAAIKEIGPYRYDPHARNIIPKIVQDICDAVEKHHGRLTPSVYDSEEYSRSRGRILQEIISEKHFDERHGPNFVNVIDKKKIQDNILYEQSLNDPPKLGKGTGGIDTEKKRGHSSGMERSAKRSRGSNSDFSRRDRRNSLDSISSISSSSIEDFRGGGHVTRSSASKRLSKSRSRDRHSHSRSYRSRSRSRARRSFSISPISDRFIRRRKKRSQSPAYRFVRIPRTSPSIESKRFGKESRKRTISEERKKEKSNWEKYRRAVEEGALNLDKALKDHEKNPEKHPLYPDEWKKFWNRRYRELQAEKKDPTKHDFKPEWIVFWTKRMKELHEDALEKMKSEIRKKFNLPEEKESLKAKNIESDAKSTKSDKLHVIDISDDDSISLHSIGKLSAKNDTSKRSTSPISDDFDPKERSYSSKEKERVKERDRDRARYPATDEYYYSSRGFYPPPSAKVHYGYRTMDAKCYPKYEPEQKEDEKDDGPLTVVAVLRLLTALEEHLGSLGPKINDLLAKALALEKVKGNSADELLLNEDNSVFFETVKEKLKGQLIAGVLDQHKIKAVKKAIKDIAAIIHQVNANAKKTEEEDGETKEKIKKLTKPESPVKLDEFDRHLVASKLAAALVMENKTDVSTKQMDQLINVFILMVKLAKDRKSIVKVTDMLEELHIEFEKPVKRQPIVEKILSVASSIAVRDEEDSVPQTSMGSLESLTDSDLQILLQNFKHLSSEEQHHLIAHLKKLETVDPMRVEKLRKFVDISDLKRDKSKSPDPKSDSDFFSKKQTTKSKNDDENVRMQLAFDSDDDDDYNFDDVVKAASNNLKEKETPSNTSSFRQDSLQRERDEEISNMSKSSNLSKTSSVNAAISDTKNLIASLMGSLQKNNPPYNSNGNNFSSIPTIVGRQVQLSPKAATAITSTDGVYPGMESSALGTNRNNIVSNTTASNTSVMLTTDSTNAKPRVNPGNINNMNPNMHMNMNSMNPTMNSNVNPTNPYQNYANAFNAQMNFQQQNFPQMQYPIAQQQQQQQQTPMNSGSNLFQQLFNQTQQQMYGQTELDHRRFFLLASFKARVDAVKISGLSRTRDDYVQRVGKELFSAKTFEELYIAALNTRYRLIELGIYKDLHVHIDVSKGKNATPHGYEVLFDGVELSKVTGTAGTEIGQNEGSLTVELATPNLFGRGERVSLEGRYGNSKTSDVSLKFSKPFLHTEIGDHKPEVSVGFFRHTNDVPYSGYRSQNIGILADISFLLPLRISHSIQYEASIREISIIGKSTPFQIREHCGPKMASVVRLISSMDERDSKIFPNKGYYIQLTNEYSGLGGNIGYLLHRVHSEINFPLFSGISAQISSRAGLIRRNQMWPDVPIGSLFTLGGPLSIRGFKHGGVGSNVDGYATGAQAFWAVGLHLWAPLPFNRYFGGFGNLFRTHAFWNFGDCGSFSLENMRSAVGLGLALRLGDRARIEFNYCWPLRKYNDDRIQKGFQFGIGYEFL